MVSFRSVAVAVVAIFTATVVDGCPSPIARRMTTRTTSTTPMSSSLMNSIVLNLPRGGELHEPTTLSAVESFVTSAGINNKLVVIDFTATWCGPCQQIAPLYKSLSEENTNVVFLKVDVDTNQEATMHYGVQAMPTFVLIKGGQVIDTIQGADISSLKMAIQKHQ